ncbi:RNA polymerase sigma factor [Bdellovibrionota bacterium]
MQNTVQSQPSTKNFYSSVYNFFRYCTGNNERASRLTFLVFRRLRYRENRITTETIYRTVYLVALEAETREQTPKDLLVKRLHELSEMSDSSFKKVSERVLCLPFLERALMLFRDLLGLTDEEISKCLRLPIKTIRKRLHDARLQLLSSEREVAGHA